MPTYRGGRHEHGQNYLIDSHTITTLIGAVAESRGPIIEIGPGRGALTHRLAALGRPLTAMEIDPRNAAALRRELTAPSGGPSVEIVTADFLRWHLPAGRCVIVGNLPYHLTTAMLRHILPIPHWQEAVLLVQWEVARRRAGVGGASMMTAQWWPWIDFTLLGRVPRSAFRPMPSVDGGMLRMTRRAAPLLAESDRRAYRGFVHAVFTGRGRGLPEILSRIVGQRARQAVKGWLAREGLGASTLPKDLSAEQWAALDALVAGCGWSPRGGIGSRGDRSRGGRSRGGRSRGGGRR